MSEAGSKERIIYPLVAFILKLFQIITNACNDRVASIESLCFVVDMPDNTTRSRTNRSRITNGKDLLRGINGRSAEARRYRDLIDGFSADLGGTPGQRELALIRQAAALTVQSEVMQAAIVRGEAIDVEQLTRLANVLTRTLKELGIHKGKAAPKPSLREKLMKAAQE